MTKAEAEVNRNLVLELNGEISCFSKTSLKVAF